MNRLPNGYIEVEYIESTGSQYIDTGFYTAITPVKYHIVYAHDVSLSRASFFGARESNPTRDSGWVNVVSSGSLAIYVGAYSAPIGAQSVGRVNDLTLEITSDTEYSYSNNGVVGNGSYSGNRSEGISQYLFATNSSGVAMWKSPIKIYSFSITENGNLSRNFVPCIDPNGEVGMYDTVTATFFRNSGTGTFIVGNIVVSQWLITDRSPADVEAVRKLAEAIKNGLATEEQVQQYLHVYQKGAYTYEDMNRVEAAVTYVANRLKEFGYDLSIGPVATWSMEDKPNKEDFDRYFWHVAQIRSAITVWKSTPVAPDSVVGFDVNKANALEQILVDVDQLLNYMKDAWFYSGDLYMAEV